MSYSPEAVFNQPPPLEDYNLFDSDCALQEAVHREGAAVGLMRKHVSLENY